MLARCRRAHGARLGRWRSQKHRWWPSAGVSGGGRDLTLRADDPTSRGTTQPNHNPTQHETTQQSVSQSYTPPSMEDGPTRTHTLHTIGSGADTRHAVTGRSTGSGLLDAQHTAHRTAHEVALYSGVLRDRHGRRRWSTGTGTQDSRTDIPTRAGGGGARERRGIWTRSLAGARPQIRRQSLQAASAIRAGSQKRSGAVLTASSQRTTEFTMMSEEKGCSCGTMR